MKKIFTVFLVILGLFISLSNVSANSYVLDNSKIDNLFSSSTELSLDAASLNSGNLNLPAGMATFSAGDKDAIVAAVLAFFLGGFAIHRYYLGTKSTMFFYYFCTCGGIFGVVPLIDFVMLLVNSKDITPYINNENFIMF